MMNCEGASERVTYSQLVHLALIGGEPWLLIECSSSNLMANWAGQSTGVLKSQLWHLTTGPGDSITTSLIPLYVSIKGIDKLEEIGMTIK